MASRSGTWLRIYARSARLWRFAQATARTEPRRILLPHHSLLGDTILLTATRAKLREHFPDAQIVEAMPEAFVPLFEKRPYGVTALGWNPAKPQSLSALFAAGPFDLALINGDARFSWLARAMETRHIVAFEGDRPAYKNWPVTQLAPVPDTPMSWSEMAASLAPGPPPRPYQVGDWDLPDCVPFTRPEAPYAVFHVGASHPHKQWSPQRWAELAASVERMGLRVCWSAGPGEESLVRAIPGQERQRSFAGALQLTQVWHLLRHASLVVCGDTGVAHLARAAFAPTVVLFGPSSPVLGGPGEFWANCPTVQVAIEPFPCRDQRSLFKRHVHWVRRCTRGPAQCPEARCMLALTVDAVRAAIGQVGRNATADRQRGLWTGEAA